MIIAIRSRVLSDRSKNLPRRNEVSKGCELSDLTISAKLHG